MFEIGEANTSLTTDKFIEQASACTVAKALMLTPFKPGNTAKHSVNKVWGS